MLEREVKLKFASPAEARGAVAGIGAVPCRGRRLQHDVVLDTEDGALNGRRSLLRVRAEEGRGLFTFKGPVQPAPVKLRDEVETGVDNPAALLRILALLGLRAVFRYEKYREEFTLGDALIAIDETPVGTFVEIEGSDEAIAAAAAALGRTPADYVLESYRALYLRDCERRGLPPADMLLGTAPVADGTVR